MSATEDESEKARLIAKAWEIMERTKRIAPDEALQPLIEKGIIDDQGQVILDMRYAMPPSNGNGKPIDR